MNDIERSSKHQPKALIANAGLIGIQVTPVASDSGASSVPTDVDADLPPANDTLLKLKIDQIKVDIMVNGSITHGSWLKDASAFIFRPQLVLSPVLRLQACLRTATAV
ncbi:hypothetical protein PTMSG1_06062 [Pyrenophora teres f. maculata]|nr:hypothetical protein PTMSG1_06062 [Pyrenophora teres f. maculata]